jgi:hypothetical protein
MSFAEALYYLQLVAAYREHQPRPETLARTGERLPEAAEVPQKQQLHLAAA